MWAALRSNANLEDVDQKKTELKRKQRELEDTHPCPFDDDVQDRLDVTQKELNKREAEHDDAVSDVWMNVAGAFINASFKVLEKPYADDRLGTYGLFVILTGVGLGGIAGAIGLVTGTMLVRTAARNCKLPVIREYRFEQPPVLTHSLPPTLH